jgi:hypothetical protein
MMATTKCESAYSNDDNAKSKEGKAEAEEQNALRIEIESTIKTIIVTIKKRLQK